MTTLIVTLPQEPAHPTALYDYVVTRDGSTVDEQSSAPLALLPLVGSKGGEVVAVVAARDLSWHQVQLPRGTLARGVFQDNSTARLRAVLEGLLEDRLLDDPTQLHFAIEPAPSADGPVWVAVCDRAWLRAALHALEQSGRTVTRIVPEITPDSPPDTLYVLGEPGDAQLVFAGRAGVLVWPLSSASVALLDWPGDHAIVAEPAVAALAEQLFKHPVALQQRAQRRLQALQSRWDLAQFDLVNSSRTRLWKGVSASLNSFARAPRWRVARVALLALLAINLAGLNAWAWREQVGLQAQRAAIQNVLTSTFPSVQVVVDAPLQMAREVAVLQRASGTPSGRDLEAMLGIVGSAAPVNTVPDAIEFVSGELRLRGLKLPPETIDPLIFKLQAQGYAATAAENDTLFIKQGALP